MSQYKVFSVWRLSPQPEEARNKKRQAAENDKTCAHGTGLSLNPQIEILRGPVGGNDYDLVGVVVELGGAAGALC